jgi:hypothetical protein
VLEVDMPSRICLKDPIPEIAFAAGLLRTAVDLHKSGHTARAAAAFAEANHPTVREWTESIWGAGWLDGLHLDQVSNKPPKVALADRVPKRMPNAAERRSIVERDGYHCRFCGIPVVPDYIRKRMAKAYPDAVPWGRTNRSQHAALQAMWLQFDHVVPHAKGGTNDTTNLVVTCAPCNFGKANFTVEELGLIDPRNRDVVKSNWNGLTDFA